MFALFAVWDHYESSCRGSGVEVCGHTGCHSSWGTRLQWPCLMVEGTVSVWRNCWATSEVVTMLRSYRQSTRMPACSTAGQLFVYFQFFSLVGILIAMFWCLTIVFISFMSNKDEDDGFLCLFAVPTSLIAKYRLLALGLICPFFLLAS